MRRETGGYDAFLSYAWDPEDGPAASAVSDAAVARRLRYAMQDLGKSRTRRSDLGIFLDRSVQTPSPDLWRGILDNLDRSRFLIVLCSPRAAASDGVAREVQHWLDTGRSLDDLLVVLCGGSADEALPAPLQRLRADGKYDPLFVDLRWVRSARDLDSRTSSRFREDVATLLAPIRGVAKETLVDEELTVRDRSIRVQRRFITGLSVAVVLALVLGLAASVQWRRADGEARIAESRALAAGSQNQLPTRLDVAQLLAVEGFRRDDNLETRATLLRATLASPSLVRYLDAGAPISVLTASTDGKVVVAGTETGALRRWSVDGDGPAARDLTGLTKRITAAATTADGAAVVATDGGSVLVWRGDQPAVPVPLAPSDKTTALGLSPSGRWLVVALENPAGYDRGVVVVVDLAGAVPVRRSPVGLRAVTVVVPAEDEMIALDYSGGWQRLRLSSGALLVESLGGIVGLHDYADGVSPDGEFFAWTNGSAEIPVWRTGRPADGDRPDLAANAPGRNPETLAVAPGGGLVAVADSGAITVSRTRAPTALAAGSATLTGNAAVTGLRFLDPDRRLVSASGSAVALWDLDQIARSARWTPTTLPNPCNACAPPAVAASADGAYAALVPNHDTLVTVAAQPTGAGAPQPSEVLIADSNIAAVRWTDPATLEVTLSAPAAVTLRDGGADGPVVATASAPAKGAASLRGRMPVTVVVRAARDEAAVAARARVDALLDTAGKAAPRRDAGPAVFAPDRATAAAVVHDGVLLMNLADGATTTLPVGDAQDVALTADRLLVSRASGPLEIRDRATGAVAASVAGAAAVAGSLVAMADGSLAARLRRDGTVEVVDIARASVLGVLGAPTETLYGLQPGLAFTPDGTMLLVAYTDRENDGWGTLDGYDLAPDRLVQVACATAGRDLTPDEWRQFVNDSVPADLRCARPLGRR